MMIKIFLFAVLLNSLSAAHDSVSWILPHAPSGTGALDTTSVQKLTLCSQATFNRLLIETGCSALPNKTVSYQQLNREDALALLSSGEITYVPQGEAKIRTTPSANNYFATHSLMDCVGICILTPQATLFTHMDILNICNGKLSRLLDRVDQSERATAKVTLISAFKSKVLSTVLEDIKSKGYKNIALDVENGIMLIFEDHTEKIYPANSLGLTLSTLHGITLDQLDVQIITPPVCIKGFLINAKTGQALTFVERRMRENDHGILFQAHQLKQQQTPDHKQET